MAFSPGKNIVVLRMRMMPENMTMKLTWRARPAGAPGNTVRKPNLPSLSVAALPQPRKFASASR
ncbi:hypothetical protein D3C83_241280 [compost metagenome]